MKPLDHASALLQYSLVGLNQSTSRRKLKQTGEQAALFCGYLFAYTHALPFSYGGARGYDVGASVCAISTRLIPFCRRHPTSRNVLAVYIDQTEKVKSIMALIRKGYSRPLYIHTIRNFPTLEAASHHVDLMLRSNALARFNIQQTAQGWSVGRVCA